MIGKFLLKIESLVSANKVILIVLLGAFLLRLPSLFEPLWYIDEAIYVVVGQEINRGSLLYSQIFDHKTPGIYYLAARSTKLLGHTIWSFKFLLLTWMLPSLIAFYVLGKKLFDKKIAIASLVVLAILTSTIPLEGNLVNSELLMILPSSLGILLGLNKRYFAAGLLFSASFLLKFTGIFDFGAFFVFLILSVRAGEILSTVKNLFRLSFGWIVPILVVSLYFFIEGGFSAYINSILFYNVSYTSYGNSFLFSNSLLVLKLLPVFIVFAFFAARGFINFRKTGDTKFSNFDFLIIWLSFTFYAAVFGGRPYEHYLIQAVPAFSLIIGAILFNKSFLKVGLAAIILVSVLVPVLEFRPRIDFGHYYFNFFKFVAGKTNFEEYTAGFGQQIPINYAIASYVSGCAVYTQGDSCIIQRTQDGDKLYIFANEPAVYFLSGLQPASKYITFFHLAGTEASRKEASRSIAKNKPGFILVQKPKPGDFPELEKIINSDYNLVTYYENFVIYQLKESLQQ